MCCLPCFGNPEALQRPSDTPPYPPSVCDAPIMEVDAGGGQQLAPKDVLVHGDPYDYAYEDTLEQHALLYDKTGNQLIEV